MWNKIVWEMMTPQVMKQLLPLKEENRQMIETSRDRIRKIFTWESDRKILIIWPCSIDYEESFLEYWEFIKKINEKVKNKLEIILRFYPGKPRTIWGWKWLVYSAPWEDANMWNGIYWVRAMALRALELWFPLADEMLNPHLVEYVDDYLSYIAVWARSTENQYHREVSSGLDSPVWFKNPTSWDVSIMTNSIKAWQTESHYILWNTIRDSIWNPLSHGILRWGSVTWPNYSKKFISEYINYAESIKNPAIIIDASHDNCRIDENTKDPSLQIEIIKKVMTEIIPWLSKGDFHAEDIVKWFMVESYIYDWNQKYIDEDKVLKWKSLTDPCIWLEKTEELITSLYDLINSKWTKK